MAKNTVSIHHGSVECKDKSKQTGIVVQLTGINGNAFAILAKCRDALFRNGFKNKDFEVFRQEAISDDYNHLVDTCFKWFIIK